MTYCDPSVLAPYCKNPHCAFCLEKFDKFLDEFFLDGKHHFQVGEDICDCLRSGDALLERKPLRDLARKCFLMGKKS